MKENMYLGLILVVIAIPAFIMSYLFHTSPMLDLTLKEVIEGKPSVCEIYADQDKTEMRYQAGEKQYKIGTQWIEENVLLNSCKAK